MINLSGYKVLIVDDDPDLRELVADDFNMVGAEVAVALSGTQAITKIQSHQFDFILSDVRMPNGDGRFLAKELLKLNTPKPLLFVYSGFSDITPTEAKELNIVCMFSKPYSASEMMSSILSHLKPRVAG